MKKNAEKVEPKTSKRGGARPNSGGKRAGSGRKKGVPNKLTGELKSMVLGALADAGGQAYLKKQANKNPAAFMTLLGKILPLQVTGNEGKDLIPGCGVLAVPASVDPKDWETAVAKLHK